MISRTLLKLKASVKENVKKMRRQATNRERIFAKGTSDKGLLSKMFEELLKLNNKKTNGLVIKLAKTLTDTLPKKM